VKKLPKVEKNVANEETETASFVARPKNTIHRGVTMCPPPTPAIGQRIFKHTRTKIPPISIPS